MASAHPSSASPSSLHPVGAVPLNNLAFVKRVNHVASNWSPLPAEALALCTPQAAAQRRSEFEERQSKSFATRMQATWDERRRAIAAAEQEKGRHIQQTAIMDAARRFMSVKFERLHSPELSETLQRGMWGITRRRTGGGDEDDSVEPESPKIAGGGGGASSPPPAPHRGGVVGAADASHHDGAAPTVGGGSSVAGGPQVLQSAGLLSAPRVGRPSHHGGSAASTGPRDRRGGGGQAGGGGASTGSGSAAPAADTGSSSGASSREGSSLSSRRRRATNIELNDYVAIRSLFKDIDDDGNGFLELHELLQFRRQYPTRLSSDLFQRLMLRPDGKVFFDEFLALHYPAVSAKQLEYIVSAYERRLIDTSNMSDLAKKNIAEDYDRVVVDSGVAVMRCLTTWWRANVLGPSEKQQQQPQSQPAARSGVGKSGGGSGSNSAVPTPAAGSLLTAPKGGGAAMRGQASPSTAGTAGLVPRADRSTPLSFILAGGDADGGAGGANDNKDAIMGGIGGATKGTTPPQPNHHTPALRRPVSAASNNMRSAATAAAVPQGTSPQSLAMMKSAAGERSIPPPPTAAASDANGGAAAADGGAEAFVDIVGYLPPVMDLAAALRGLAASTNDATHPGGPRSAEAHVMQSIADRDATELWLRLRGLVNDNPATRREQLIEMERAMGVGPFAGMQSQDPTVGKLLLSSGAVVSKGQVREQLARAIRRLPMTFHGLITASGGATVGLKTVADLLELLEHRGLLKHVRLYPALALLPAVMYWQCTPSAIDATGGPNAPAATSTAGGGDVPFDRPPLDGGTSAAKGATSGGGVRHRLTEAVLGGQTRATRFVGSVSLLVRASDVIDLQRCLGIASLAPISLKDVYLRAGVTAGPWAYVPRAPSGGARPGAPRSRFLDDRASSRGGLTTIDRETALEDMQSLASSRPQPAAGALPPRPQSSSIMLRRLSSTQNSVMVPKLTIDDEDGGASSLPEESQAGGTVAALSAAADNRSRGSFRVRSSGGAGAALTFGPSSSKPGGVSSSSADIVVGHQVNQSGLRAAFVAAPHFLECLAVIELHDYERLTAGYHMMLDAGMMVERYDPTLHESIEAMNRQWDEADVMRPHLKAQLMGKSSAGSTTTVATTVPTRK